MQVILDAAVVGDTGQQLLAASLSGNTSQPLQLVNGSSLSWAGSVGASTPGHIDKGGSTVVDFQLLDVPVAFLAANYTCMFLDYSKIQALKTSVLQVCLGSALSGLIYTKCSNVNDMRRLWTKSTSMCVKAS